MTITNKDSDFQNESEPTAKQQISYQISKTMARIRMSIPELAFDMKTGRNTVYRLLDPDNDSLNLKTLNKAVEAMGHRIEIKIIESDDLD